MGVFMNFKWKRKIVKLRYFVIQLIQTIIGTFIMAIGISLFLLPNQLSSGGFSGIATITYYLFKMPVGLMIVILNIPLFIIAFFRRGKNFLVNAIIGTVLLSCFIDLFEGMQALTTDRLLACIYGGIIVGIGTAIVLKADSSTGGTELVTHIIKSFNSNVKTGKLLEVLDIIVVGANVIFFKEIEVALYSALAIYLMGKMIDLFFEGIGFTKMILIISPKYIEISDRINKEIRRGTTCLYGRGMYKREDRNVLMCVASRSEIKEIRKIIKSLDPRAFIIITNVRETIGQGFQEN